MPACYGRDDTKRLRQGEGDERVALFFFGNFGVAACGDHEILLAARGELISHWRRVCSCGQFRFPQFLAAFQIKGTKESIDCAGDKDKTSGGDNGSSQTD